MHKSHLLGSNARYGSRRNTTGPSTFGSQKPIKNLGVTAVPPTDAQHVTSKTQIPVGNAILKRADRMFPLVNCHLVTVVAGGESLSDPTLRRLLETQPMLRVVAACDGIDDLYR